MALQLQIGKKYLDRDGHEWEILVQLTPDPQPYLAVRTDRSSLCAYEITGKALLPCQLDLVSEVPNPQPTTVTFSLPHVPAPVIPAGTAMYFSDYIPDEEQFSGRKCECGSTAAGLLTHSAYCPLSAG